MISHFLSHRFDSINIYYWFSEFNFAAKSLEGPPSLTKNIIPHPFNSCPVCMSWGIVQCKTGFVGKMNQLLFLTISMSQ